MSLRAYQKQVDDELQQFAVPYWHPLSQLARLTEEVGEVARIINHKYGEKPKKQGEVHEELGDELADVLFDIICLANTEKIDLDKTLEKTIAKVNGRDRNRFERKKDTPKSND
jgi:NTP pyrophosphatase (non-canonical NTP hydrolase)